MGYNAAMPKEYTHLMIARAVRDAAPRGLLSAFPQPFYLGSIIPDTLYYLEISPGCLFMNPGLAKLPALFHEGDTGFIPRLFEQFGGSKEGARAFLLGVLCHGIADHIFHPLVWRLSRGANEPARVRHVRIEAALDLAVAERLGLSLEEMDPGTLVGYRDGAMEPHLRLYAGFLAQSSGMGSGEIFGALKNGLRVQCKALALFRKRFAGRIAALFDRAGLFKRYAALFYSRAVELPEPELFLHLFDTAVSITASLGEILESSPARAPRGLGSLLAGLRPDGSG